MASGNNADDFLLSFEKLFPGTGSVTDNNAFNLFATDGKMSLDVEGVQVNF